MGRIGKSLEQIAMKAALLLAALIGLYCCTPVSPYLSPPGGIKVGFTKTSVETVLGRPEEAIRKKDKLFYIYKQLQWAGNTDRDIYETLFLGLGVRYR